MPLHEPSQPPESRDPVAERHNARLGLVLFAVYLIAYAGFVVACAVAAKSFDAVAAGMGLIAGAMAVSLVYAGLCRSPKGTP
jgi:hypothetical protein